MYCLCNQKYKDTVQSFTCKINKLKLYINNNSLSIDRLFFFLDIDFNCVLRLGVQREFL